MDSIITNNNSNNSNNISISERQVRDYKMIDCMFWMGSKYVSAKSGLIATVVNDVNVLSAYLTLKAFSSHIDCMLCFSAFCY